MRKNLLTTLCVLVVVGIFSLHTTHAQTITATQPSGVNTDINVEYSGFGSNMYLIGGTCNDDVSISSCGYTDFSNIGTQPNSDPITYNYYSPHNIYNNNDPFGYWIGIYSTSTPTSYGVNSPELIASVWIRVSGGLLEGYTPTFTLHTALDTRFIEPYTPYNGTLSSTTSIIFTTPYYFNDVTSFGVYDTVGFDIKDVTNGTGGIVGTSSISSSGYATSTLSTTIEADHTYLWRPIMYSLAGSSSPLYGSWYSLTGTSTAQYTPYTPTGANTLPTTTPQVTDLLSFLNVPYLLETKIPFAYFFEAKQGIEAGLSTTSAQAFPTATFQYKLGSLATSSVTLFSTSTLAMFVPPTEQSFIRGILLLILYGEFIYAMYHRARKIHI